MALQLGTAIGRGAQRSLSISGIVALVLMICHQVLFVGSFNAIIMDTLPSGVRSGDAGVGFALPLPTEVAAGLAPLSSEESPYKMAQDGLFVGLAVRVVGSRG
jgi:hypothetical protein